MTATGKKARPEAPVETSAQSGAATRANAAPAPGTAAKAPRRATRKVARDAAVEAAPGPAAATSPWLPRKAAKAAVVVPPATAKPPRAKEKLVRDSFTMPQADFALIHELKDRAMGFRRAAKKSELLRAGLQALAAMDDSRLQALLAQLPALKAGRPKKSG